MRGVGSSWEGSAANFNVIMHGGMVLSFMHACCKTLILSVLIWRDVLKYSVNLLVSLLIYLISEFLFTFNQQASEKEPGYERQ